MSTNTHLDAESPDTDTGIDANLLTEDRPNDDTARTTIPTLAGNKTTHHLNSARSIRHT